MIKEILHYKNIGTPNYLIKVLRYANKKSLSQRDLQDLFFKESIDGRHIFDGGINFLLFIKVLKLDNNKILINYTKNNQIVTRNTYLPTYYIIFINNNKQ